MAIIACPECKSEVSDSAAACPKCGHPIATTLPEQADQGPKGIQATCPHCSHNNVMPEPWPHPGFNCGSCGKPVRFETPPSMPSQPEAVFQTTPQVIEQIGRPFKGMQAFGCLGIFFGLLLAWGGFRAENGDGFAGISFILLISGLIFFLAGWVGGRWNHG